MTKVLLVGNYKPDRQHSMLGFLRCLAENVGRHGFEVRSVQPRQRFSRGRLASKYTAYLDKLVLFPRRLASVAALADVVHVVDQGNAVYLRSCAGKPTVLTCHDLLPLAASLGEIPGWTVRPSGKQYQQLNRAAIPLANVVACVSQFSLDELRRLVPEAAGKARLVRNGLYSPLVPGDPQAEAARRAEAGVQGPYLLHVGGDSPYKNRPGLLRIFASLVSRAGFGQYRLVLAGHPPPPSLVELGRSLGIWERVVPAPHVSPEALAALYRGADALLFPSLLEGFGLPVVEAMAYGCPVFASDRPPLPEVGGEAARFFDPDDPEAAAAAVAAAWGEREGMRRAGLSRAEEFATERMVEQYCAIYRELAG